VGPGLLGYDYSMANLNAEQLEKRNIVGLGLVSLFNDLSSEVISRVLPLYILAVVGSSFVGVGVVEAIAEATSILGKLISGYFSDHLKLRKPMVMAGYALSVVSRPLLVIAPTLAGVSVARFFDKAGKAVRTPARDALIADMSHEHNRGKNFGINRALDTLGAVIGLVAVIVFLRATGESDSRGLRIIILAASAAGVLALFVLGAAVKEPSTRKALKRSDIRIGWGVLDSRLRYYLVIASFFALASSSDAFLVVRAKQFGFSLQKILFMLVIFNLVAALTSVRLSKLSDKVGRKVMLMAGWLIYTLAYFIFGLSNLSSKEFFMTMVLYGFFYSFTEGVEKALVADFEAGPRKGLAYGWLGLVQGVCIIPANLVFAYLYQDAGGHWAFWLSGAFALIGVIMLAFFKLQPMEKH
jgi:MFS family permease